MGRNSSEGNDEPFECDANGTGGASPKTDGMVHIIGESVQGNDRLIMHVLTRIKDTPFHIKAIFFKRLFIVDWKKIFMNYHKLFWYFMFF